MDENGVLFDNFILFIVFRDRSQRRLGAFGGHTRRRPPVGAQFSLIPDNEHEHGHVPVAAPVTTSRTLFFANVRPVTRCRSCDAALHGLGHPATAGPYWRYDLDGGKQLRSEVKWHYG